MAQIPTITKNLLIINIICFLAATVMGGNINFNEIFGLHYWQATNFHLYQLVTYMFMHDGWVHLFFNMFALWMFGGIIERTFGQNRFLIYYIICGLGAALCQELSQMITIYNFPDTIINIKTQNGYISTTIYRYIMDSPTVGASGSIYGLLLAFGMAYPEERLFVFPLPVPLKAKWFVCGYIFIELYLAISNIGDGVAHVAHLGGMLFGYIMIKMWRSSYSDYNYHTNHYSNGWDGYEIKDEKGSSILSKIRKWFHIDDPNDNGTVHGNGNKEPESKHQADWNYNANKKKQETEIDKILDKIRRSGYASLTEEEKKKLFDQSKFNKI